MASLSYDYDRIQNDAWLDAHENSETCPYCHNAVYQGNWRKHMAIKHSTITDPMTYDETRSLATHEAVITAGLDMFYAVGKALATIHEQRLYRATHGSFKAYCAERWNMSRQRGYQLMKAAGVVDELSKNLDTPMPTNDAQARAIGALPAEIQATTWQFIYDVTDGKPTGKNIKHAGKVIKEALVTGAFDPGTGESVPFVAPAIKAAYTYEVAETEKRHQQYIADGIAKKEARLAAQSTAAPTPPAVSEPTETDAPAATSPSFSIEQRDGVYVAVMVIGEFGSHAAAMKAIAHIQDQLAKDC